MNNGLVHSTNHVTRKIQNQQHGQSDYYWAPPFFTEEFHFYPTWRRDISRIETLETIRLVRLPESEHVRRVDEISFAFDNRRADRQEVAQVTNLRDKIMSDTNQLLETWEIHNRINLYLLGALAPEALKAQSPAKGRTVGELFAHMHNVRLMWLKAAAPDSLPGLEKLEKTDAARKNLLHKSLVDSGKAIRELVSQSLEAGGRVKGFKPHANAFVGYLISHESHHRGQIVLLQKQAGHRLDNKILYGMWEWGGR